MVETVVVVMAYLKIHPSELAICLPSLLMQIASAPVAACLPAPAEEAYA